MKENNTQNTISLILESEVKKAEISADFNPSTDSFRFILKNISMPSPYAHGVQTDVKRQKSVRAFFGIAKRVFVPTLALALVLGGGSFFAYSYQGSTATSSATQSQRLLTSVFSDDDLAVVRPEDEIAEDASIEDSPDEDTKLILSDSNIINNIAVNENEI